MSAVLRRAHRFRYLLALLASGGIFVLFAALRFGPDATPFASLAAAALPTALCAAAFAYVWPRRAWRWGLVLSSAFTAYLAVVFVAFAANGVVDGWPLFDALVIAAVAVSAAWLGGARSDRRDA